MSVCQTTLEYIFLLLLIIKKKIPKSILVCITHPFIRSVMIITYRSSGMTHYAHTALQSAEYLNIYPFSFMKREREDPIFFKPSLGDTFT